MSEGKPEGDLGPEQQPEKSTETNSGIDVSGVGMTDHWKKIRYNYTPRSSGDPEFSSRMRKLHSVDHMRPDVDRMILDHRDAPARAALEEYSGTLDGRFDFTLPDGTPMSPAERLIVLENAMTEAEGAILTHETELLTNGIEFDDVESRKAMLLVNRVFQELHALTSDPVKEATDALRQNEVADLEQQFSLDAPEDIPAAEKTDPHE